jgi:hypothetical protein
MTLATRPVGEGRTREVLATCAVKGRRCTELTKQRHTATEEAPNQTRARTIKMRSRWN